MILSYIMPVYNGEKYLSDAIESILNQPNNNWKLIIINDGSKDSSLDIINNYSNKYDSIKVINQENHGVDYARNRGVDIAQGKYIIFIDQDDIVLENSFNDDLCATLESNYDENVDVIGFKFIQSNDNLTKYNIENSRIQSMGLDSYNKKRCYMIAPLPIHVNFFSSRLFKSKGLRFNEKYRLCDTDNQFCHNLFYHADNILINNNISFYCWRSNRGSTSHSNKKYIARYIEHINCWCDLYDEHLEDGDINAANYCLAFAYGAFYYMAKGVYMHFGANKIWNETIPKLKLRNKIHEYAMCENVETINGLDKLFNHRLIFSVEMKLYRIILFIRKYLVKIALVNKILDKRKFVYTKN